MTVLSFFVSKFPVSHITHSNEDQFCHMPAHPRSRYRYLDAVLEHIDNSNCIDPIQINVYSEQDVQAGPSGVSRLFALTKFRNAITVPAIVNTKTLYPWFIDPVPITSVEQLLGYFSAAHLPKSYSFDERGCWWHNHRLDPEEMERTMQVSDETKLRLKLMLQEENQ